MATKAKELWEELLAQNPTNEDLRYVIEWVEALRQEAWQKLLVQNPTNEDLRYVIEWVEALRQEAKAMLKRKIKEILADMKIL